MFTPVKNTKVYEQVIEQIKDMVFSGKIKKGDKLPPERELVEQLQASRASIREAIRALQIVGIIECRQGGGNYIKENFEESLFEPLSIMFVLQNSKPIEILELRKVIEVETAALAAEKITKEELEEIAEIIDKMKASSNEEINSELDKEFHHKVAAASRNFLVLSILKAVSFLIDSFIKDARKRILKEKENKEILIQHHENLYKALLNGDGDKAALAMKTHLNFVTDYLISK